MSLRRERRNSFSDVSSKVPLPEVARIFRKIAQKKEENLAKLQGLALNQTLKKSILSFYENRFCLTTGISVNRKEEHPCH